MKKRLKKIVTVFFVLSLFFTLAWVAIFAVNGIDITKGAQVDFQAFLSNWLVPHVMNIVDLFTGKQGWLPNGNFFFILTYVGILFAAISVVLLVLGCVYNFKYKRKRALLYAIEILAATFVVLEFVANYDNIANFRPGAFPQGYVHYLTFSINGSTVTIFDVIYTSVTTAFAACAYIFMVACTITGLVYAKCPVEAPAEEVEEDEDEEEEEEEVVPEVAEEPAPAGEDVDEAFGIIAEDAKEDEAIVEPEEIEEETLADKEDFADEPEPTVEKEEVIVEEVPQKDVVTKDDLASILKDVVRDIVRDEIARSGLAAKEEEKNRGDHSITGATFGGPLIVQYFNGGIQAQEAPKQAQAPVQQPQPQPQQQPVEEKKEEAPRQEKPVEPAPQKNEEVVAEEEDDEKNPIIRIPFTTRMLSAEKSMQNDYNELKNEILSYGVNSRVSNSGDTFRLHRKTYVKITIAGKSLKLYFALDPADYIDSKMPIGDASHHAVYQEIPLIFKVKSGLSMRRAKELIRDVMSKDGLEQGEVGSVNWIKELRAASK